VDKSPDAFRTISEVAGELDLPQHVLRFWETRFTQIKPMKRGGGRRYYRPDDLELLRGIRHLLYSEGYTIKGVQRILREQGVRHVMTAWHDGASSQLASPETIGGEGSVPIPPQVPIPQATQADDAAVPVSNEPAAGEPSVALDVDDEPIPRDIMVDGDEEKSSRSPFRFIKNKKGGVTDLGEEVETISKDDIRRLQSTLFELLECKRLLDQAR